MSPADIRPGDRFLSLREPDRQLVLTVESIVADEACCTAEDRTTRYATFIDLSLRVLCDPARYQPLPAADDGEGDGIPAARRKELLAGLAEEEGSK